jgi:hypothetical protein
VFSPMAPTMARRGLFMLAHIHPTTLHVVLSSMLHDPVMGSKKSLGAVLFGILHANFREHHFYEVG